VQATPVTCCVPSARNGTRVALNNLPASVHVRDALTSSAAPAPPAPKHPRRTSDRAAALAARRACCCKSN